MLTEMGNITFRHDSNNFVENSDSSGYRRHPINNRSNRRHNHEMIMSTKHITITNNTEKLKNKIN